MEPWQWVITVLAGGVGQFLDTVAGMGFGALSSSVMLAGGLAPAVVVGTVSLAKIGSGFIAWMAHWRAGNVRPRWVFQIAGPGIAGGFLSAYLLTGLPASIVRVWVPVVLLIMGVLLVRNFLQKTRPVPALAGGSKEVATNTRSWRPDRRVLPTLPLGMWLSAIGFVAGFANGLSGAFGPVATTAVVLKIKGHPRYSIGSVNAAEFFVALAVSATVLARLGWGVIGWQLPLALVAGSLFTAPLGAYLASHLPARVVGMMLGVVLLVLNGFSVWRALA